MRAGLKKLVAPASIMLLIGAAAFFALQEEDTPFAKFGASGTKEVRSLFRQAVAAFKKKRYQRAIATAEKIRAIEIPGQTDYLSEAKQIIDTATVKQKEEFEPFMAEAREAFIDGEFDVSRQLCQEMLKRDPGYKPAKELLKKIGKGQKRGEYDEIRLRLQTTVD